MPEYAAYGRCQIDLPGPNFLPRGEAYESKSPQRGTIKSFLLTNYREKKTASEVTGNLCFGQQIWLINGDISQ